MSFFITDPETGKKSEMVTLTVLVTLAVIVRFLLDGLTLHIFNQVLTFSKLDAMVYVSLLSPVWGSHAYVKTRNRDEDGKKD